MKLRKVVLASIVAASQLVFAAPKKKAILVVPGSFVKASAYDNLIGKIEDSLGESLLVEKTSFLGDFPTRTGVIDALKKLKNTIEQNGFEADITVLAHSQGGLSANSLETNLANRIVRMASYQRNDWFKRRSAETLPTLTLGGKIDKLTTAERILFEGFKAKSDDNLDVVLLREVNHFQFADGRVDSRDNLSPISTDEAHTRIAKFISAFMRDDLKALKDDSDYVYSKELIEGYIAAKKRDERLCEEAQIQHLGPNAPVDDLLIKLESYNSQLSYPKFIIDKSKLRELESGKFEIEVYQYAEQPTSPVDIKYLNSVDPSVIGCKLRSAADVARATGYELDPVSCLDVNLSQLRATANLLPITEKDRLASLIDLEFSGEIETDEKVASASGKGFLITDTSKERGDQWALLSFSKLEVRIKK